MGFETAIDLRRFARPGVTVIAETRAGSAVRLTFGGVARASATAAAPRGLVRAGDELSVCLGPEPMRLAAAFEVVSVDAGEPADTVGLLVRRGAVPAGGGGRPVPGAPASRPWGRGRPTVRTGTCSARPSRRAAETPRRAELSPPQLAIGGRAG